MVSVCAEKSSHSGILKQQNISALIDTDTARSHCNCSPIPVILNASNPVGYSGAELRLNAKIAGAAFVPVSGEKTMDLTEIKVTGYDPFEEEGGAFGEVYAQVLNDRGKDTATYFWLDYINDETGATIYGWYKDSEEDQPLVKDEVILASGEGILVKCSEFGYNYQLQSAGQVLTDKDMPTKLRLNARMVANVTPTEVDLKDCYVTGYTPFEEDGGAFGEVYVQVLDDRGKDTETYFWLDYINDESGAEIFGWYKDSEEDQPLVKGTVVMKAGQGILAKCSEFYDEQPYFFVWPKVDMK